MAMSPLPMQRFIPPRKRFPTSGSLMTPPTGGAQPIPQTGVPTTNNPIPLGGSPLASPFGQPPATPAPMMSEMQKRNAYMDKMAQQRPSNRFSQFTAPSYGRYRQ
jgi:hypothetical protein